MGKEYEAKFLDIDIIAIKKKLLEIGAKQVHPSVKYVRSAFFLCDKGIRGFARIRNEGGQNTMTAKIFRDPKYPDEYEISINEDFETGRGFLSALGITEKAFQESYREKWSHPDVHEIVFDTIPGIPTFMEIDCTSENALHKMMNTLGLKKEDMRFGGWEVLYGHYYGIDAKEINDNTPSLTFANIKKEIKPLKNAKLLDKLAKEHKKQFSSSSKINKLTKRKSNSKSVSSATRKRK